jgi:hypothetical protein
MTRFLSKGVVLVVLLASLPGTAVPNRGQNTAAKPETKALRARGGLVPVTIEPGLPGYSELHQYTAGGHVLGFRESGVTIASGNHALRVDFVNARRVFPAEEAVDASPTIVSGRASVLGRVTYRNLWDGVTAVYEKAGSGLVKSTYQVQAGKTGNPAPVDKIRLRYNVPVKVDMSGGLVLSFVNGEMRETRPVAWQEVSGTRVDVEAEYRLLGDREVGFEVGPYDSRYPLVIDPTLSWHTFLGSSDYDRGRGIAPDTSGNVYVVGYSNMTWGVAPIRPFTEGDYWMDAFVAKLGPDGTLLWHTFLGGAWEDFGEGIAVDTAGNCYVTGWSTASWGSPIRPFTTRDYTADAFVAKLNTDGALLWNTFLGGAETEEASGIAVDASGNSYALGFTEGTWGSPIRAFTPGEYLPNDAYVAKLDTSGILQWNTFLGGAYEDFAYGIAADTSGNSYVTGESESTWGENIVDPFVGDEDNEDAFVAKLASNGVLLWNTFMGAAVGDDIGNGIAADTSGNVYVTGHSDYGWGEDPVDPFSGDDAFVIKLNTDGARQWHSFLGWSGYDEGFGIAVDTRGCVYVVGTGEGTWGSPVRPFTDVADAFLAKVDANGFLQWNTFLGGADYDFGYRIALDALNNCYVIGDSYESWGTPLNPFAGGYSDAFVARIGSGVRVDFNKDGQEDILWRYGGGGGFQGWNVVWLMNQTEGLSHLNLAGIPQGIGALNELLVQTPGKARRTTKEPGDRRASSPEKYLRTPLGGASSWARYPEKVLRNPFDRGAGLASISKDGLRGENPFIYATMEDAEMAASASGGEMKIAALGIEGYRYLNTISDLAWEIAGTGDFDGDTDTDILWRNYGAGAFSGWNVIWYMNGAGGIDGYGYLYGITDLDWKIVGTGDFDGDTDTDILWRNTGTGSFSGWNVIWYMDGEDISGYGYLYGISDLDWRIVGTGDFNRDGELDILWRNTGTGSFSGWNVVWYMAGESISGYGYLYGITDLSWEIAGTGDFNSDGYVDILWRHYGAGGLQGWNCIWYMQGESIIGYDYPMTILDTNWRIVNR